MYVLIFKNIFSKSAFLLPLLPLPGAGRNLIISEIGFHYLCLEYFKARSFWIFIFLSKCKKVLENMFLPSTLPLFVKWINIENFSNLFLSISPCDILNQGFYEYKCFTWNVIRNLKNSVAYLDIRRWIFKFAGVYFRYLYI